MNLNDMTLGELIELYSILKQKQEEYLNLVYSKREKFLFEFISGDEIEIDNEIQEIEKLIMLKKEPIILSDEIDLRKVTDSHIGKYYIFLHNKNVKIGSIDYNGYHSNTLDADAGIYIDKQYRGNSYAYKATNLLRELLSSKGIDSLWLSVRIDNIPSIKTIKRMGGILLKNPVYGVELYEVPTKKIELREDNIKQSRYRMEIYKRCH